MPGEVIELRPADLLRDDALSDRLRLFVDGSVLRVLAEPVQAMH
jgi:hypothetical protein